MFCESEETVSRRGFLKIAGSGVLAGSLPLLSGCIPSLDSLAGEFGELARQINQYRRDHGKTAIPISAKLSCVAFVHIFDLTVNHPDLTYQTDAERARRERPLHSWTPVEGRSGGRFDLADARTYSIMWDKPREIAGYPGRGYEIATYGNTSAADAIRTWEGSAPHLDVILNRGMWAARTWRALGAYYVVGDDPTRQNYACAWFGEENDPESIPG